MWNMYFIYIFFLFLMSLMNLFPLLEQFLYWPLLFPPFWHFENIYANWGLARKNVRNKSYRCIMYFDSLFILPQKLLIVQFDALVELLCWEIKEFIHLFFSCYCNPLVCISSAKWQYTVYVAIKWQHWEYYDAALTQREPLHVLPAAVSEENNVLSTEGLLLRRHMC